MISKENLIRTFFKKDTYKEKVFCWNCDTFSVVKIKKGLRVLGTEAKCNKCGLKSKIDKRVMGYSINLRSLIK